MAPVKVFGPAMSTSVTRVLVCLEEVGAEYEVVDLDRKISGDPHFTCYHVTSL
jgi:glutathione S-transferase